MKTTKGNKVEGLATVTRRGSINTLVAWESQVADFTINGNVYTYITDDESKLDGIEKGDEVILSAFARPNGRLYRVSIRKVTYSPEFQQECKRFLQKYTPTI